jgi:predicted nucleotidyltransferase
MTAIQIQLPTQQIEAFCQKWLVDEFALFGSVLRDDFGPDSDIDVMLNFSPASHWSLLDMVDMKEELEALFGRKVDVLTRSAIERSRNPRKKKAILESARVIHRHAA